MRAIATRVAPRARRFHRRRPDAMLAGVIEDRRTTRPTPPAPPDAARLREAALGHLARYATTEARLRQILLRRIDRWARIAAATLGQDAVAAALPAARAVVPQVVAALAAAGALSDQDFAAGRVRSLRRAGRSRRAIAAHLLARGVPAETARAAAPADDAGELRAALLLVRRRRLGPFRAAAEADARRERAVLARAGFTEDIARAALACTREAAEALLTAPAPDPAAPDQ